IRGRDHEIVMTAFAVEVDGQPMRLEVRKAARPQLEADGRHLHQPPAAEEIEQPVAIVGREEVIVLGQLARNLVHLRGVVERSADEEDACDVYPSATRLWYGRPRARGISAGATSSAARRQVISPTSATVPNERTARLGDQSSEP